MYRAGSIPMHQKQYPDARRTVREIEIHFGNFLITDKWAGIIHPPRTLPPMRFQQPYPNVIKVWKTEEKGSNVDLGVHLVRDALPRRLMWQPCSQMRTLTLWEDERAIARFAGEPIDQAKYYDFDTEFLLKMAPKVVHFQVEDG